MKKIMFCDKYGLTQAVLDGKKTQTRRNFTLTLHEKTNDENYMKQVFPDKVYYEDNTWKFIYKDKSYVLPKQNLPKYNIGEVIAIAQSYSEIDPIIRKGKHKACLEYMDSLLPEMKKLPSWKNKMFVKAKHMPHQIQITNIRCEKLQDISEEDCLKEGIVRYTKDGKVFKYDLDDGYEMFTWQNMKRNPKEAYAILIDKVNKKGTWKKNNYVWVYDFILIK